MKEHVKNNINCKYNVKKEKKKKVKYMRFDKSLNFSIVMFFILVYIAFLNVHLI